MASSDSRSPVAPAVAASAAPVADSRLRFFSSWETICVESVSNMCRICVEHVSNLCRICVESLSNLRRLCIVHSSNLDRLTHTHLLFT